MCQYAKKEFKVPADCILQSPARLFSWGEYEDKCSLILAYEVLCYMNNEEIENYLTRSRVALHKSKPSYYIFCEPVSCIEEKAIANGREKTLRTKDYYD